MSKTYHQKVIGKVKDFIRRVHSDRSVSLEQTLDSLELLRDEIEGCIIAVREDIEREIQE